MRCPLELLDDLTEPGVFYARRLPFLHFHLAEGGRRRADIKCLAGWRPFDLPRPVSAARRRQFLRALRTHHAERARSVRRDRRV